MKCKICGKKFELIKENRYEVVKRPVGFSCLTQGSTIFEAFDCPKCGCQNIVNVKEPSGDYSITTLDNYEMQESESDANE